MPGDDNTDIEWVERDSREWKVHSYTSDQMTARMTCTYLESYNVESRVGSVNGRYCVEVPLEQHPRAMQVAGPTQSDVIPPMQEESAKTGVHTGRRLRAALKDRSTPDKTDMPASGLFKWALRVIVLLVLAGLLLLVFGD